TCASSTRPPWIRSPPSSMAALDKPWASRHPHRPSRRRCTDPLRPRTILRHLAWTRTVSTPEPTPLIDKLKGTGPDAAARRSGTLGSWVPVLDHEAGQGPNRRTGTPDRVDHSQVG